MLDKYMESQNIVYKTLTNAVNKNTYSHAYLFETNGNEDALDIAISFAKTLLCPNNYTNNNQCVNCTQCQKIDKNIFSDIKIIEPDGMWIKKEQLDELQREFSKKSVESNKKIYIINNAELLNVQASNSILKFLEEPEENIIAILVTKNIYQLLTTIVSRCQIISLKKNKEKEIIDEEIKEKLEYVNNFIKYLEKEKIETLLMTQKLWHEYFKERKDYINGYELILIYYKDVLNFKLNRQIELFNEYKEEIEVIANNNTFNNLIYKINKIIELKEHIKINANQSLLLDKLIIELSRGDIDG
ncbi:MAG: hypothetical protein E7157_00310 [Lactobacillales bacterium]|nr:hypothetical protein [Lactobacillales bacterium]